MTTISQPIWILVGVIGIADICLFWWCMILMRRARDAAGCAMAQDEAGQWPGQPLPLNNFQQNLVCLQIDAVFNGLVTLIETERIKLKSLMRPMVSNVMADPQACMADQKDVSEPWDSRDEQEVAIDQQIAQIAASGKNPTGIASQLGISLAEVDLAMKMQTTRRSQAGRKLEAVA